MIDACRTWRNDDGIEYLVITARRIISERFFARPDPQDVIMFKAPSGEVWTTVYSGSTSLHRQPDYELRAYLGMAKHDSSTRLE
jgi:hypothetical protein